VCYFFVFPFTVVDLLLIAYNRIGGVMVSALATHVVDHGFESMSGKTRDYKIDISCFFGKHPALRFARNQDNVSEWSTVPINGL
jgi:hypothetical protein